MKGDKWKPSQYSVLCEKHFKLHDYAMLGIQLMESTDQTKKYLKADAVPSVFNFPLNFQNKDGQRKSPRKRKAPSPQKHVAIKKPRHSDHPDIQDYAYSMSSKKVIPKMKKCLEKRKRKIRALTSKNLRKEKTIKGLLKKLECTQHLSKEQSQTPKLQLWTYD